MIRQLKLLRAVIRRTSLAQFEFLVLNTRIVLAHTLSNEMTILFAPALRTHRAVREPVANE